MVFAKTNTAAKIVKVFALALFNFGKKKYEPVTGFKTTEENNFLRDCNFPVSATYKTS